MKIAPVSAEWRKTRLLRSVPTLWSFNSARSITRVSAFLFGLGPYRTAATACFVVAQRKRFPEGAVPPTNSVARYRGLQRSGGQPNGEARLWAYHNTGTLWCQNPPPHCFRGSAARVAASKLTTSKPRAVGSILTTPTTARPALERIIASI